MVRPFFVLSACLVLASTAGAQDAPPAVTPLPVAEIQRTSPVDFEKEILPVLSTNCLACHNRTKAKADLVLETPTDILKGGESGPAVVPKKGDDSLLLKVTAHRVDPVMPPKGNKVAAADLNPEQLGLLKLWIDQGATGTIGGASVPTVQWQPLPAGLNSIYAVALTNDGQYAAAARGNEVHVYHLPSARLVARLGGAGAHRDLVQSLAFSPDGSMLASGGYREVKLWRRPRDARKFSITSAVQGPVTGVDVSPDGATLATGGADGAIRLWSATDGRPVRELKGHTAPVNAVRFSPDGTKLASVSADKTVRMWTVADGTTFAQGPCPVECTSVVWVAVGKKLVTAGADSVVRVWPMPEAAGGALAPGAELKGHEGNVPALCAFPSQPTQVVSAGADGTVRVWDVDTGKPIRQLSHAGAATSVAVRPDGKRIATAGGNVVKLWDAEGKLLAEMKGDRYANEAAANRERDLAFAASEVAYHKSTAEAAEKRHAEQVERVKKTAAADVEADKALAEKQKAKAAADAEVAKHQAAKTAAEGELAKAQAAKAPEADVARLVAAKTAAEAELTKAQAAQKGADVEVTKAQAPKNASADELRLAIKSAQGAADAAAEAQGAHLAAEREHVQVGVELASLKAAAAAAENPVRTVAFSADNLTLAAGGEDEVVHTFSAENGGAWETFRGHRGSVTSLTFAGLALVSGGREGAGIGWDISAQWLECPHLGTGDANSPFADRVTALDFSADGKFLATGGGVPSRDGEVLLWDVGGASLVRRFERLHSDAVLALDLSPDGKFIATAAADRFMKVSEVATGRVVKTFEGHTGHVLGVSFQRTGRTLATGAADNAVKVWDLVSGEQKKAIPGFEKEVTAVRFVGDTDQFVTASGDGRVRLLKPDGGEVRSFAGASGFVYAAAASRDGSVIVAGGEDGVLRAWNGADGKVIATLPPPKK